VALVGVLAIPVAVVAAMPGAALAAQAGPPGRAVQVHPPGESGSALPTATTLAETGGGLSGIVTFTATVTHSRATETGPVVTGTVTFFATRTVDDSRTVRRLGSASSGSGSSAGVYTLSVRYAPAGPQNVVAVYDPPAGGSPYRSSRSPAVGVVDSACGDCSAVQTVADVPPGVLSISTPYTTSVPLYLGALELNATGTFFSASALLDPDSSDVPTAGEGPADPTFNGITVVDTQASNTPWSITAWSGNLSDDGTGPMSVISGENVGLTGLVAVPVPGNPLTAADLTFTDQPAADPPVGPADTGSLGLGGAAPHLIVADSGQADGTIGINGTITINAPSSTEAGTFGGEFVLTVEN
jgi:hypothetical protein